MRSKLIIALFSILFVSISTPSLAGIQQELRNLEHSAGGRLGISAVNTANDSRIQYRANERFPIGCTSKVMNVAAILKASQSNPNLMQEKIHYQKNELVNWSPITEKHLTDGMKISELCAAAISYSDNTAMNLLTEKIGGLQGFNEFARSIGDKEFRLDHRWPDEALSGPEGFDSSTPNAMEKSLNKLVLGDVLTSSQREQLQTWLKNNTTGNARIRAGVPKGWVVGDKTGTGIYYGTTNDIAVIWPPNHAPIILVIFYTSTNKNAVKREDILASAARIIIADFAGNDPALK